MKKENPILLSPTRRDFLSTAAALGTIPFFPNSLTQLFPSPSKSTAMRMKESSNDDKSIIGNYGSWAAQLANDPPLLSLRNAKWTGLEDWRNKAKGKTKELLSLPFLGSAKPEVIVKKQYEYDGLHIEELEWQLPYGRITQAVLLKPANTSKPLPAVLGLHDHGGQKYFGKRKITRTADTIHPMIIEHQKAYYSDRAWANELAKKGFVVLVHDVFTFGSRRVLYNDVSEISWGACHVGDKTDDNAEAAENINSYNEWAAEHEHIMAKSLFCAGTTWPGLTLFEDQKAVDVLCAREDVDENRIGCCGLSGGGLRTVYLGGIDERIQCAISVGFMSTWRDFLMHKAYTHTWMMYVPLLPKYLAFPEIIGLRAPLPTMVMCDNEDTLFTLSEMKKANEILKVVYTKAGAPEKYSGRFYPGEHKFDAAMQKDAFEWMEQWLK